MMTSQEIHDEIIAIIHKHLKSPGLRIYLYGSRAKGQASPTSDFDVALDIRERIDWAIMEKIRSDLSESDIPVRVDLIDLQQCSSRFKEIALVGTLAW